MIYQFYKNNESEKYVIKAKGKFFTHSNVIKPREFLTFSAG